MARFEHLRWVPMLIEAYHNAQMQLTSTQTKASNGGQHTRNISAAIQTKPLTSKNLNHRKRQRKPAKHVTKIQNLGITMPEGSDNMTLKLRREIRAINRKLKGLNDVHLQLRKINTALDEFNQRVGEMNTSQVSPTVDSSLRAARFQVPRRFEFGDGPYHIP